MQIDGKYETHELAGVTIEEFTEYTKDDVQLVSYFEWLITTTQEAVREDIKDGYMAMSAEQIELMTARNKSISFWLNRLKELKC